jgi:hypothetical protein
MTGEAEHGLRVAVARPEILHRSERHALDAKAQRLEARRDQLQTALILGADRRSANELGGQVERVGRGFGGSGQGRNSMSGAGRSARTYIEQ